MKDRVKAISMPPTSTIRQAMQTIQGGPHKHPEAPGGIALIVDKNQKLLGIVTDGDIRRALLRGASFEDRIRTVMNRNPVTFSKDLSSDDILAATTVEINKRRIGNKRLDIILTTDKAGRPYDIFRFFELWKNSEIKTRVVSIVGLGYVGLTLGLVLAEAGFQVIGVDHNRKIIRELAAKKTHIHEQGVSSLLKKHLGEKFFVQHSFKNNDSDVYIICVGTPVRTSGSVDYTALKDALRYLIGVLKKGDLVILRSTVPVGTCRKLVVPFLEKHTGLSAGEDFYVTFAPERTVEGRALKELRELPQIIGGYNKTSLDLTVKLFDHLTSSIVLVDDLESAEMVKLLNNTYRDVTFSFANEAALICGGFRLDTRKVILAANQGYERSKIPMPSPGVGGYCLTKDPYILAESARSIGIPAHLPGISRQINDYMIDYVAGRVDEFVKKHGTERRKTKIFVMGLAFKGDPETRDTRGSTGVSIAQKLLKTYPNLSAYDAVLSRTEIQELGFRSATLKQGFRSADCVLVLNNHPSYRDLDVYEYLRLMRRPGLLLDTWNVFGETLREPVEGISHQGI